MTEQEHPAQAEPAPVGSTETEPTMTGPAETEPAEAEWERKRRLARIFGDVLPETTRDDRDEAGTRGPQSSDDWLKAQVPPHHGG